MYSRDDFKYEVNPDFDFVIEENNNSSIALRKISWNERPEKIDLRKYTYVNGEERMLKGVSLSDEAVEELANVLVEQGFGKTKRLLRALREREDYQHSMDTIDTADVSLDDEDDDEQYYDPSELIA